MFGGLLMILKTANLMIGAMLSDNGACEGSAVSVSPLFGALQDNLAYIVFI
jgi:hypothetical protein